MPRFPNGRVRVDEFNNVVKFHNGKFPNSATLSIPNFPKLVWCYKFVFMII